MLPGQQEWEGSWSTPESKPLAPSEDRLGLCCNKDFKGALPPDSAACAAHGKPPSPSWRWRVPCCLDYSSVWDSSWNRDKAANMGIKPTSTSLLEIVRSDLSFQGCRALFFLFFFFFRCCQDRARDACQTFMMRMSERTSTSGRCWNSTGSESSDSETKAWSRVSVYGASIKNTNDASQETDWMYRPFLSLTF